METVEEDDIGIYEHLFNFLLSFLFFAKNIEYCKLF